MKETKLKSFMQVWVKKHREKAVSHSIILALLLSIPFFAHKKIDEVPIPENTRPDDVEYRVSMVGDMMLGRHVQEAAQREGEPIDRVFSYVTPYFEQSDYSTGNFENPVIDSNNPEVESQMEDYELHNKDIHLYAEAGAEDALINAGFDSVNLANNHTMDYGDLSLTETLNHMRDADIDLIGIGDVLDSGEAQIDTGDEEEEVMDAGSISYFDINENYSAAVLGFTDVFVQGYSAGDYVGGVLTNDGLDVLQRRIKEAKEQADVVIVHAHWGDEYQVGSNQEQENLAWLLTDIGADIIIGHHSHVLEPVTVVETNNNTSLVMNSLGNFVFDQGWSRTKESTLAQLDFLEDGSADLSFIPMQITDTKPRETKGILKPYRDYRIFRTLRKELDKDLWRVEDSRLIIDMEKAGVLDYGGSES
ncbi:PGA biosynthesis protein CapA [Halobacillus andaensis]|uniref:PGA biosynthesis protein CapA n=1 Tax=Halobacillus andaensis TaxID=1176239 RepID=A0A917EX72_HALAA|nr:CapA family protein [Halobacillus andaensis]MBP2004736.1 poly-gamma-glutamate synthesis protein (capsule biosynthesis protein) [Halobacillus andaensis]GGF19347.1 PGA biosynthesis protein CapA [Halobacillus andaensis]